MNHQCHAKDCRKQVPPKMLMCAHHWRMVSPELQKRVWDTYRPGQEIDKQPSAEYMVAQREAIEAVAAKEQRPATAPDPTTREIQLALQEWALTGPAVG